MIALQRVSAQRTKEDTMKRIILFLLVLILVTFFTGVEAHSGYDVKKSSTIEKNLSFGGGSQPLSLEVDNVFGYIHLEGYSGSTVKLVVEKTVKAKSKEKLQQAEEEVTLEISTKGNAISVIVDGPFRCDDGHIHWNSRKRGYIVQYDFRLKVPRKTALKLKTINKGDIDVKGIEANCELSNVNDKIYVSDITGDFDVHTVNGGIRMQNVLGSGSAHTVNGKVLVDFVKNPASDCSFHTINGKLDINFRAGLSADFKLKTFNGKIYSDFPATYLPTSPGKGERKKGKYIYKSNRFQGVRIGSGGPTIKMDTLNGNIYISKGE
jgi:hypothetical protein